MKEHCRDSRKEVDRKLKVVCEAFIEGATRSVVGDLKDFLNQVYYVWVSNFGVAGSRLEIGSRGQSSKSVSLVGSKLDNENPKLCLVKA